MSIAIVTGSAGLIGSEMSKKFHGENFDVVGIDNDTASPFFWGRRPEAIFKRLEALLQQVATRERRWGNGVDRTR